MRRAAGSPFHAILVVADCLGVAIAASVGMAGGLTGPILDEGVAVELRDVVQLPASAGSPPLARVGILREVPDGSGRLFANDLRGRLHVIQDSTVATYMDLSALFPALKNSDLQLGFVSYAFHPEFASNGLFYTVHTEFVGATPPNLAPAIPATIIHHSVVTEWQATDPAANAWSGTHRELMRIAAPHTYHNLGEIGFDPDLGPTDPDYGLLYIAAGDFGSVELGQPDQVQRLDTVYGCLLRIEPLGEPFERGGTTYPYGIPAANPFANDGDPATFGEIFAYGFRNPQNFHFDRGGLGTLLVAEIGQGNVEEVNLPRAGSNYGWPQREGTFALDVSVDPETVLPLPGNDAGLGFTYPVAQYDHDEGQAIAGGLVVRRGPPSALQGKFVFGDVVSGRMFYADMAAMLAADDGNPSTTAAVYQLHLLRNGVETTLLDVVRQALGNPAIRRTDLRFSTDTAGRLYVTTKQDGFIRELVPIAAPVSDARHTPGPSQAPINVPNPFNPSTVITFQLAASAHVRLRIRDAAGRVTCLLVDQTLGAGEHGYVWNGRDRAGEEVPSGVYLCELVIGSRIQTRKMSLIR